MSDSKDERIDEVSLYYKPAAEAGVAEKCFFVLAAALSLSMPYYTTIGLAQTVLQSIFIVFVLTHFTLSQVSRFYLVPRAERARRRQMLSDAFDTPLTHEKTSLYYNNNYSPSLMRLGANTMENALFSKEIAGKMLVKSRLIIGGYLAAWVIAFSLRHNNLHLLTWITQFVFSSSIVVKWINLEILRFRHENTFEKLHLHFLHEIGGDSKRAVATILDAFAAYEATKASAGILLSTKVFQELNPSLSEKWQQIRKELKMNFSQGPSTDKDSIAAPSSTKA